MEKFEKLITMLQSAPSGFKSADEKELKAAERAGICYEVYGLWYLQDEFLK